MRRYTLIITEKPDAAEKIASALSIDGRPKRMEDNGVPYYLATNDKKIVVAPVLGHMYTVSAEKKGRSHYPVFSFKWVPRYLVERRARRTRTWLQVIAKLSKGAAEFIDACDYDMEGSIIGYCVLKYACGSKEGVSRRMKFSTMTPIELEKSYTESQPHLDFALIEAGMARHEVDWLYGINLSRALTLAAKHWCGRYNTLSTGRVQGPLLKLLVSRENSIRSFVPEPYWRIKARVRINGKACTVRYAKAIIETKKEAESIANTCKGEGLVEEVYSRKFWESPPVPFDIGTLQVEAYRLFRYSPKNTMTASQSLYLDALISYPRTSSQKLPQADHQSILRDLSRVQEYRKLATDLLAKPVLKPNEGSGNDPAHPAIYPTGNLPKRSLSKSERDIWDLIVRRFMAVFGDPALRQSVKATINDNGRIFYAEGRRTLEKGWQEFYGPYVKSEETCLPFMKKGESVNFKKVMVEGKFTEPPPRYNPSSLLEKMEEVGIGTKATRADAIQTLYERKYVRDNRMTVTDLGFEIFEILKNYCNKVVSVELTEELEDRINKIREKTERREDVLASTIEILRPVLKELKQRENEIGERLAEAVERTRLEENVVGACPVCKTGQLAIIFSKKTGKRFVGCTNYFKGLCKVSFALPQKGTIKLHRRNCVSCGWPTVQVRTEKRRKWVLCFNSHCPLKGHDDN
jgi:DNA topoisomerase-1